MTEEITVAQYKALTAKAPRGNKFNARRVQYEGYDFGSEDEVKRYRELRLMQAAGEIAGLRMQVHFAIDVSGQHICDYVADFVYLRLGDGRLVVEDVKSPATMTAVYRLKKKLLKATWGLDIDEIFVGEAEAPSVKTRRQR